MGTNIPQASGERPFMLSEKEGFFEKFLYLGSNKLETFTKIKDLSQSDFFRIRRQDQIDAMVNTFDKVVQTRKKIGKTSFVWNFLIYVRNL